VIAVDSLSIEAIRRQLDTATVGWHLYLFGDVGSTNGVLHQLARAGAGEGTVVLAEGQTEARGRLGRGWFSPSGVNVYASALFRERIQAKGAMVFSLTSSLALADAIKGLGLHPAIKWPNDVLVERKKVAGVLTECAMRGDAVDFLILGVGVNVNVDESALHDALGPAAFAATSLSTVLGREVDRNAFAASYLNHLEAWVLRYRTEGAAPVLEAWRQRDILSGRRVEVRGARERYDGRVLGIDDQGRLLVQSSDGAPRGIVNEEIRILD
jgi:BirA family biotin operon repressor/biotin-[acetyl-CoA-carboxylase] ligase